MLQESEKQLTKIKLKQKFGELKKDIEPFQGNQELEESLEQLMQRNQKASDMSIWPISTSTGFTSIFPLSLQLNFSSSQRGKSV